MTNFQDFGLTSPLLQAIAGEGYTQPTPIQQQAIPAVIDGRDIVGIAQTGTGKTAAFALPVLHHLAINRRPPKRRGCRVLVLAPTRELAQQIGDGFRTYGSRLGVTVAVVVGGVSHRPQVKSLAAGVDVLVATPGRLLDHINERNAVLDATEIFILDEADQMLDLGFIKPIRQIASLLPARRQTLLFSATMPTEITTLADSLLRNPVRVAVTPVASTSERVVQRIIMVESARKKSLLVELLSAELSMRTLIFTRTKRGADRVARHLEAAGVKATAIHGNKSQSQRQQALGDFRSGRISTLVATDIAARGIDVDGVTHVVNYELPEIPESYVHRIGRTARAGATGTAISLCDNSERSLLRDIERLTRQSIPTDDRRNDRNLAAEDAKATGERHHRGRRSQDNDRKNKRPTPGHKSRAGSASRRPDEKRPGGNPAKARVSATNMAHRQPQQASPARTNQKHGQDTGTSLAGVSFLSKPTSEKQPKPKQAPPRRRNDGDGPRRRKRRPEAAI